MTQRDEEILEHVIPVLESMKRELDECDSVSDEVKQSLDLTIAVATKELTSTPVS